MRGLRVPQPDYISDDMYQLMLQCWQLDLDERPDFAELEVCLTNLAQNPGVHVSFEWTAKNFLYEKFVNDLEFVN